VKIYVASVEALRKKERGDETQFTTNIGGKGGLGPSYFWFQASSRLLPVEAFFCLIACQILAQ